MYHVSLSYKPDLSLPPLATIKVVAGEMNLGNAGDPGPLTLEQAQERAKGMARGCLPFGYAVEIDLLDDSDAVLRFKPVHHGASGFISAVLGCQVGSFNWQVKEV